MSLIKKIGLAGLPIILLGYYFLSLSSVDQAADVKDELKFSLAAGARQSIVTVKIPSNKTKTEKKKKIAPAVEYRESITDNNLNREEDSIPWEEINQDWHVVLKNHLLLHLGLSEEKVEALFNLYMDEKKEFDRINKFLGAKQQSLFALEAEVGELDENNRKVLDETNSQLDRYHDHYVAKVKGIFGDYYASLSDLHRVYNGDLPYQNIIVDAAFVMTRLMTSKSSNQ